MPRATSTWLEGASVAREQLLVDILDELRRRVTAWSRRVGRRRPRRAARRVRRAAASPSVGPCACCCRVARWRPGRRRASTTPDASCCATTTAAPAPCRRATSSTCAEPRESDRLARAPARSLRRCGHGLPEEAAGRRRVDRLRAATRTGARSSSRSLVFLRDARARRLPDREVGQQRRTLVHPGRDGAAADLLGRAPVRLLVVDAVRLHRPPHHRAHRPHRPQGPRHAALARQRRLVRALASSSGSSTAARSSSSRPAPRASCGSSSVPDVEQIQREIYRLHDEDDERRRRQYSGQAQQPPQGYQQPPQGYQQPPVAPGGPQGPQFQVPPQDTPPGGAGRDARPRDRRRRRAQPPRAGARRARRPGARIARAAGVARRWPGRPACRSRRRAGCGVRWVSPTSATPWPSPTRTSARCACS